MNRRYRGSWFNGGHETAPSLGDDGMAYAGSALREAGSELARKARLVRGAVIGLIQSSEPWWPTRSNKLTISQAVGCLANRSCAEQQGEAGKLDAGDDCFVLGENEVNTAPPEYPKA